MAFLGSVPSVRPCFFVLDVKDYYNPSTLYRSSQVRTSHR